MGENRRLEISEVGGVTVVNFVDRKILDDANIMELGDELTALVEQENRTNLLLNFANVHFLSSAALNKIIMLDRKLRGLGGKIKLCCLRPQIYEVFVITRLNTHFDIKDTQEEALKGF